MYLLNLAHIRTAAGTLRRLEARMAGQDHAVASASIGFTSQSGSAASYSTVVLGANAGAAAVAPLGGAPPAHASVSADQAPIAQSSGAELLGSHVQSGSSQPGAVASGVTGDRPRRVSRSDTAGSGASRQGPEQAGASVAGIPTGGRGTPSSVTAATEPQ